MLKSFIVALCGMCSKSADLRKKTKQTAKPFVLENFVLMAMIGVLVRQDKT